MKIIEYVADFETTSVRRTKKMLALTKEIEVLDNQNSEAFVCAWGLAEIKTVSSDSVITGRTLEDFLANVSRLAKYYGKGVQLNIFTHNLKFDAAFILYYVLNKKIGKITDEKRDEQLYSFKLTFKDGISVMFRDSQKIFNMSVDKLGKIYGIDKLKGEWDYNKYRDHKTPISEQEWEYVKHDVLIVCKALNDYREKGFTQNTAASIAYNQRLKTTYPRFRKDIANKLRGRTERFRECFPFDIIPLKYEDQLELSMAYFGGWNWLNPHYEGVEIENVPSYDKNSMYPDKMANAVLPIGEPLIYDNPTQAEIEEVKRLFDCYVLRIENLTAKLKDEWSIPMMMFDTDTSSSVRCQGKVIQCESELVYLTNYDYEMLLNEYNVKKIKITKIYAFAGKKGQYRSYVMDWMKIKEEHTTLMNECITMGDKEGEAFHRKERETAKLMLNSPYGKDGTKIIREARQTILKNGILDTKYKVEKTVIEYYLPSAIFITALARYDLYKAVKAAGKYFIYSDTDSVKGTYEIIDLFNNCHNIVIDDVKLGAWKLEEIYDKAKFVRQKTYATYNNGEWRYTVCGATDDMKKAFQIEDFKRGMVITVPELHMKGLKGRLVPVSVKGGVILQEQGFQIADKEDWTQFTPDNLPIQHFIQFMQEDTKNASKEKL